MPPIRSERGLTLIEMLVAMAMAIVVTGAAVAMLVSVMKRQPDLTERSDQVGQARVATERLVRDVRQAVVGSVNETTATGKRVEFETYVDGRCGTETVTAGKRCKVVYSCAAEKCTRASGGATTGVVIAEGVKNYKEVFEYVKGPSPCSAIVGEKVMFLGVKLELKSKMGGVTDLQDGASLRSCS